MATVTLNTRTSASFAKFGRSRTYGLPRHLSEHMLKDNSITVDDLGLSRKR